MTAAVPLVWFCCPFCGLAAESELEVDEHVWFEHMVDVEEVAVSEREGLGQLIAERDMLASALRSIATFPYDIESDAWSDRSAMAAVARVALSNLDHAATVAPPEGETT